jgi:hypothetical protein
LKAAIMGALIGLWFALSPIPTWAASLPPGVSDQVVFSGSQIGTTPLTFNFDDSPGSEASTGFFQIPVGANVTIPAQTFFHMSQMSGPCGPPFGCILSDALGFTSTPGEPGTGPTLTFSLLSDSDLSNLSGLSNCVEGSQGCGIGAFQFVDGNTTVLRVDLISDPDLPGVPEPSTLLLVGPGLAGLALWGRKTLTSN